MNAAPPPLRWPRVPRRTLLFSGHRVDEPGRAPERFPPRLEPAVAQRIGGALDALQAGPHDLALTQGAAGADLLFAEACLARAVPLHFLQPLPEPAFIAASVRPSADGERWCERYRAVTARLAEPVHTLPAALGDPFAACNRWLVETALAAGGAELHLVCVWNGGTGDGPGGTSDLVARATAAGAELHWIDTRAP